MVHPTNRLARLGTRGQKQHDQVPDFFPRGKRKSIRDQSNISVTNEYQVVELNFFRRRRFGQLEFV